jgi:hypothetical protein
MHALRLFQRLFLTVSLAGVASPAAGAQWIAPDLGALTGENTAVTPGGGLAIDEVVALESSGYWYRYPWGYGVWDIQLAKSGPATGFTGTEWCLRVADNAWASQALYPFNGRLMRAGPYSGGTYVATLANGTVVPVPDFAARPASLAFLTYGSHGGASAYSVTLNYAGGGPAAVVVPIASASVYPRDASDSGWSTQAVTVFTSVCAGRYGDVVVIPNPRPASDLVSIVVTFDGAYLTGPIAMSLTLSESDYMAGYVFTGAAWSGSDQATALRAPGGSVTWQGIDWSATLPDGSSQIAVRMYCGEAASGGSVLWQYAGAFTLAAGSGSADFAGPCAGEFVRCEVDMVAGLDASPVLDSLRFRYVGPAAVGDAWRLPGVRLDPAVPNPFRTRTALRFEVAAAAHVRLAVYDVSGRLIRTLVEADLQPGVHDAFWDGRDDDGQMRGPGAYVARLAVAGGSAATWLSFIR